MSNNQVKSKTKTENMVMCAILTALVIVLQLMGSFIRLGPFSISLVLVPIVIGAAVCGRWAGGWLGLVFGIIVLFMDSAVFMAINPLGTIITVIVKGAAAGLLAGITYSLLAKKNKMLAVIAAAAICPIVNTGIFLIGCKLFFMNAIIGWGQAAGFASAGQYIIYGLVGGNFIIELLINMILSPVIVRLINYRK